MLDHIGIEVSDYQRAKKFYEQALAPLGYELVMEVQGFAGFGLQQSSGPIATLWLHQGDQPTSKLHVAFTASSRAKVDEFYHAALKVGGRDNGKPGIREIYHPYYYGAFVFDLDGNNIEAVCHQPET